MTRRSYMRAYRLINRAQLQDYHKRYYQKNKAHIRARMLGRRYGLSVERYQQLFKKQRGRCAICRHPFGKGRRYGPHVDHDHRTHRVRGLLCTSCNQGLGRFGDDAARLAAAARYLRRTT